MLQAAGLTERSTVFVSGLQLAQPLCFQAADAAAHDYLAVLPRARRRQRVLQLVLVVRVLAARAAGEAVGAAGAQRVVHHEHASLAGGLEVAGQRGLVGAVVAADVEELRPELENAS